MFREPLRENAPRRLDIGMYDITTLKSRNTTVPTHRSSIRRPVTILARRPILFPLLGHSLRVSSYQVLCSSANDAGRQPAPMPNMS